MTQRLPNAARASTAASQARSGQTNGQPKSQQSSNVAQNRTAKVAGNTESDGSGRTSRTSRPSTSTSMRRESTAAFLGREKPPSKDGTVQRTAKEVEGLKDFQLGDCLGRGAFGSVYRALNWSTGETVAIKQVRFADLPKAELNTIMQEIDLLKNLHHPNIVKYHGSVRGQDSLYIILEYCENGSLHTICKNFGKFPENLVSLYTSQVLQGLLFLHEQGVIHRDIKGANILTTKEGLVKLADFGVATKQQGLAEGSVVGTPYWMAPEVIELSGATTASDIWSLGCTVIELLDGRPPYHKLAPMPALFRIVNDDHPPLPEGASPLVRDFLMQCFQKDPNLRVSAKKLLKHPWIVSTKKMEKKKETVYDEAVKSVQEWNEALKASPPAAHAGNVAGSRRAPARSGSRPDSSASTKITKPSTGKPPLRLNTRKEQIPSGRHSPEVEKGDNWDDDFESLATNLAGLQLPDHFKSQDNFGGLFSSEKLKQYASFDSIPEMDGKVEEWDEEFEGDLTVRSPLQLSKGNAVETVLPFYPPDATSSEIKYEPPTRLAKKTAPIKDQHARKGSKDSQPKTQILRPASVKAAPAAKSKQASVATPAKRPQQPSLFTQEKYKEEDDEDYSDLVPADDHAFQKKIAAFSPGQQFNPNDLRAIHMKLGGSVRRRTRTPTHLVHDAAAMRRSRSSMEIQKYAEDEDEDFNDCFGDDDGVPMNLQPSKTRSPKSLSAGSGSATGSERGTLKLSGSSSWIEDEEDEDDDPFAALEEELDQVDLEENVARDKHARLCTLVEGLVSDLKLGQPEDILGDIVDQLLQILSESPDVRAVIVSSHGMLPILEILDTCTRPHTILRLLKIVNAIISPSNVEVQENLCFVGGIPIISKFAHKKYSPEIRLETAAFVRMMYLTSTLTLQMFVSCGGLNVLVEFLEEEYESDVGRELVLVGVNGVWSVFELQGPTPKNDFCRIFSRSSGSVLYPLSLVLNQVLYEEGEQAELIEGRIVNIFLLFSQAENHVKETVADRMVLKTVLKDLRRMTPQHQITMLKFIKNLSMLATTLDALQNSNVIEVLTDLLGASMNAPHFREISNQVLNTMYNLCRLSKARQEDAALSGVIPLLQRIVKTERPLKEFALPILCDMAHSGKVGRKILWQNKGLQFYVSLLADQYWAVTALDAIFIWLQEETAKVEEVLLRADSAFSGAVLQCFNESKADAFENLLEPLQKMLRLSPPVAASLAHRSLFERSAVKLHAKKPLVRLNLLRVIRSICDASEEPGVLISRYGLLESVEELARHDPAILVREMANDLVKSSEMSAIPPSRYAGIRRSSSSTMTSPGPFIASGGTTPIERAGSRNGYFELGMELAAHSRPMASSPFRPGSRDASSSGPGVPSHSSNSSISAANRTGRIPPGSRPGVPARAPSRLSLAPTNMSAAKTNDNATPTHAPPSSNTRSSVAVANARRRRQTSGAELGR